MPTRLKNSWNARLDFVLILFIFNLIKRNCTIWKKEGANLRITDFLKKGALVELEGTPFAKAYPQEDGFVRTEIRLNVSKTNILRPAKCDDENMEDIIDSDECGEEAAFGMDTSIDDFTLNEEDF